MRRLGVHTSIRGGLHMSLLRAHALGCSTVQIFSHNPRGWAMREIQEEEKTLFKKLRKKFDISSVYIHTSYLINIASESGDVREKSIIMLVEEMRRADALGAEFVVMHEHGKGRSIISSLRELFERGRWNAGLLIENTASSSIGRLSEIINNVKHLSGICMDTCHAFQAGCDIRTEEGIERLYQEIKNRMGKEKVKLIHLNDSKAGVGRRFDRHEHIGLGRIGLEGLKRFINHPPFRHIPIILETPKKTEGDDPMNLKAVRGMMK